jgi:Predicted metal-binding integral membrane protein (DUF2182)
VELAPYRSSTTGPRPGGRREAGQAAPRQAPVDEAPSAGRWVASGILLVAGLYQLTPLKDACLAQCRSPLGFLLHFDNYRGGPDARGASWTGEPGAAPLSHAGQVVVGVLSGCGG